jgi:hypothetical protein
MPLGRVHRSGVLQHIVVVVVPSLLSCSVVICPRAVAAAVAAAIAVVAAVAAAGCTAGRLLAVVAAAGAGRGAACAGRRSSCLTRPPYTGAAPQRLSSWLPYS